LSCATCHVHFDKEWYEKLPETAAMEKDMLEFEPYCIDHIKHFDCVPLEFEASSGKVYGQYETWTMAVSLGLTEYPSQSKG